MREAIAKMVGIASRENLRFRFEPPERPRVDHPNRSRTPRFAPCTDQPAVLALYREALQKLLKRLPEVEVFSFAFARNGCVSSEKEVKMKRSVDMLI